MKFISENIVTILGVFGTITLTGVIFGLINRISANYRYTLRNQKDIFSLYKRLRDLEQTRKVHKRIINDHRDIIGDLWHEIDCVKDGS